jgi:hypothetical protein
MDGDKRRAARLALDLPVAFESIGQPELALHPGIAAIYQRVEAAGRGARATGVLRDLSINGAYLAAEPLPLLSRVAMSFSLGDIPVEAIGWAMWRRLEDCEIAREGGSPLVQPRGFGVLFESIPLEVRIRIDRMVSRALRDSR